MTLRPNDLISLDTNVLEYRNTRLATETQPLATIYECKLAARDDLKKSLLHQAFSGEL